LNDSETPRVGIDSYLEWVKKENLSVVEGLGVDLFTVPTKPWARTGVNGAAVHLLGRGDFVSMFLHEIPPNKATSPQRHLYEEVVFVLEGRGSTTIEFEDGRKHSFEWRPCSVFAIPLNAKYRYFNGSGTDRALLVTTTSLPIMMNLLRNEDFIFGNDWSFNERNGQDKYFGGDGDFVPGRPGTFMWETNFIPDTAGIELKNWGERGGGGTSLKFALADGTMNAHISEMPVGTYKKAHRHPADFHVLTIFGKGYSLLWYEGDSDFKRVDWKFGTVVAPLDNMFHQHFNTSPTPSRYFASALGSFRFPFTGSKRNALFGALFKSVKEGGDQIEYEDQNPAIHTLYVEEMKKVGIDVQMKAFVKP
jgi:mannose-6-phosphate isomerase-like protein (cupin superfamily)